MILATWILLAVLQLSSGNKLVEIESLNAFKKELSSHSNILVAFLENAPRTDKSVMKTLLEVATQSSKLAKLLSVDCETHKKLCRKFKAVPSVLTIQHFHKGKFNKVYDRKLRVETMLRFLEDPIGDIPWEEDETAKNIVHVKHPQGLQQIVDKFKTDIPPIMVMFYVPWCGYCQKMKPEYAAAATTLKGKTIFIGINGDLSSTDDLKQVFNVTGYPSVFLIKDGNKVFKYDNENSRDAIIKFVHHPTEQPSPQKTAPWSEETNEIDFLTDSNFEEYIREHDSLVVMFYAPWCGHCKAMKPQVIETAVQLKKLKIGGVIAAMDSTENKIVSESLEVKAFPTLKYFRAGKYLYDVQQRSADGLLSFFRDPQPPAEPVVEVPWSEEMTAVLHPSPDEYKALLKRLKHALVMFYAPWCGHCKATKPAFNKAASRMQAFSRTGFVAVDCTDSGFTALCSAEGVTGFPTLRYFNYGKTTALSEYRLARDADSFVGFMTDPANPRLDVAPRWHWHKIPRNELVVMLETENFTDKVFGVTGGALVMFFLPLCQICVALKPEFVNAAIMLQKSLPSCVLGAVDASTEKLLTSHHNVASFPTFVYFPPSGDFQTYVGGTRAEDLVDFMIKKDQEWKRAEENKIKTEKEKKEAEEKRIRVEKEKKEVEEKRIREENEKEAEEKIRRKEEKEKKEVEEKRIRTEKEKKEAEEKIRKKEEKEKKEAEEKRIRAEKEKKETEEKKRKQEEEKRIKEEKEAEEKIRKEEEKEKKEAEEKKIKEKERKDAEEKRIRAEKEKKEAEEEKKRKQEEEKRIKEENEKKEAEEKKIREEKERKDAEEKRIRAEKEKKEAEEKKRKQEEEKRIKEENEKKEADEKKIREEKERKEAEEKRVRVEKDKKEAEEKKRNQEEEKRIKEEKDKKEADGKKIRAEKERKEAEEKIRKKEEKEKKDAEEKRISAEGQSKKGREETKKADVELVELDDEAAVEAHRREAKLAVFYMHRGGHRSTARNRLVKVLTDLEKGAPPLAGHFQVDCAVLVGLCDRLALTELPAVAVYSEGVLRGVLTGRWEEARLRDLLMEAPRPREEL